MTSENGTFLETSLIPRIVSKSKLLSDSVEALISNGPCR